MKNPKFVVSSLVNFNTDLTVIKQSQINDYGMDQDFYGLIDDQGNEIVPCECQYFIPIDHGLIRTENRLGLIGILDQAGNFVIPFSRGYQSISRFSGDRALVRGANLPLAYGFIDQQGNEVIPLQYADAGYFHNGIAAVQNFDGEWGFIDTNGKQLTPFKYGEEITDLKKNGLVVVRRRSMCGSGFRDSVMLVPAKHMKGL